MIQEMTCSGTFEGAKFDIWNKKKSRKHQDGTGSSAEKAHMYWELLCTWPCRTRDSGGLGAGLGAESVAGPRPGSSGRSAPLPACKGLDTLWALICAEKVLKWQLHTHRNTLDCSGMYDMLTLLLFACRVWPRCAFCSVPVTGIRTVWDPYGPITDTGYSSRLKPSRTGN